MSSDYNIEPKPTAAVILYTNFGELGLELFAKQTPLTCRNFLQLCLDGYYDNTVFHRLVPGSLLQGGDPTGTGQGGESIYDCGALAGEQDPWPMDDRTGPNAGPRGVGFRDEFHPRLRFTRRGILGMANQGAPNTNTSGFFFTLARVDVLNRKNTVFGRIQGDTIFNLIRMGDAEVEEGTERPMYPVKITRTEILVNPFEDMVKRVSVPVVFLSQGSQEAATKAKKKRKGGKALLSFGDDEEEGAEVVPLAKKAKFDTRVVADVTEEDKAEEAEEAEEEDGDNDDYEEQRQQQQQQKPRLKEKAKSRKESRPRSDLPDGQSRGLGQEAPQDGPQDTPQEAAAQAQTQIPKDIPERPRRRPAGDGDSSPEPETRQAALKRTREEIAAVKASMRRTIHSERDVVREEKDNRSALEKMIPETSTRGRRRGAGGKISINEAEDQRLANMLRGFQSRLKQAPTEKKPADAKLGPDGRAETDGDQEPDEEDAGIEGRGSADKAALPGGGQDESELCDLHFIPNCQSCRSWDKHDGQAEDNDEGWMSHALTFQAERLGRALTTRRKAEEELIVIDPREREQAVQAEKRAERGPRDRDRARNSQMARLASMGGRGAR